MVDSVNERLLRLCELSDVMVPITISTKLVSDLSEFVSDVQGRHQFAASLGSDYVN